MANEPLDAAMDRLEHALDRLERAVLRTNLRESKADQDKAGQDFAILKVRHRRLKDTVAEELQQLDLLLAGLPK